MKAAEHPAKLTNLSAESKQLISPINKNKECWCPYENICSVLRSSAIHVPNSTTIEALEHGEGKKREGKGERIRAVAAFEIQNLKANWLCEFWYSKAILEFFTNFLFGASKVPSSQMQPCCRYCPVVLSAQSLSVSSMGSFDAVN